MSTGRKMRKRSARQNNLSFLKWYYRLKNLALNAYEWKNLPDSVDERFLELTLFSKGYALYFNDDIMGNLALTCTIGGELNVYNIPKFRQAFATNGYNMSLTDKDSVLIYNNYLHLPTELFTREYARRIYEIERTIDVNVNGQKTPVMILASEEQRLTMKNLYMQYDGNVPFIFGSPDLPYDNVQAINTQAPYVSDKLQVLKQHYINEYLTLIGIENANMEKRERLVADEVKGNDGQIEAERFVFLNARRQAADQINKMFGTDIQVDFRSNLRTNVNIENIPDLEVQSDVGAKGGGNIE